MMQDRAQPVKVGRLEVPISANSSAILAEQVPGRQRAPSSKISWTRRSFMVFSLVRSERGHGGGEAAFAHLPGRASLAGPPRRRPDPLIEPVRRKISHRRASGFRRGSRPRAPPAFGRDRRAAPACRPAWPPGGPLRRLTRMASGRPNSAGEQEASGPRRRWARGSGHVANTVGCCACPMP